MGRVIDATPLFEGLAVGSFPPPGHTVRRAGFDTLVLCAQELQPRGSSYPGVKVIHAPFDDTEDSGPALRVASAAARHVARHVSDGQVVLVTCAMGRNRSALVCALAIHLLTGCSGEEAARHVRSRRVDREGVPALQNRTFRQMLALL